MMCLILSVLYLTWYEVIVVVFVGPIVQQVPSKLGQYIITQNTISKFFSRENLKYHFLMRLNSKTMGELK